MYRRIFFLFLPFIFFGVLTSSCSRKLIFADSPVAPAAEGTVKIKSDANNNYAVSIKVFHLPRPQDLYPARKTYVVWMETESNGRKIVGNLKSSKGLLASARRSSLKTVTPFKPVSFFITAEDNLRPEYPTGPTILRTR